MYITDVHDEDFEIAIKVTFIEIHGLMDGGASDMCWVSLIETLYIIESFNLK